MSDVVLAVGFAFMSGVAQVSACHSTRKFGILDVAAEVRPHPLLTLLSVHISTVSLVTTLSNLCPLSVSTVSKLTFHLDVCRTLVDWTTWRE